MKALLYKDFLVLWKQMKFVIFMVAIFCLLPNLGFGLNNMWVVYAGLVIPTSLLAYGRSWQTGSSRPASWCSAGMCSAGEPPCSPGCSTASAF